MLYDVICTFHLNQKTRVILYLFIVCSSPDRYSIARETRQYPSLPHWPTQGYLGPPLFTPKTLARPHAACPASAGGQEGE